MIYCPNCGAENEDRKEYCDYCNAPLHESNPQNQLQPSNSYQQDNYYNPPRDNYYAPPQQNYYVAPQPIINVSQSSSSIPPQYQPLSPWAYFGYSMLFAIPIVGFVFLIVFSFSSGNINRRNYARSYFCALLIVAILAVVYIVFALILMLLFGVSAASLFSASSGSYY